LNGHSVISTEVNGFGAYLDTRQPHCHSFVS
jgi:hypothetical protein